MNKQLVMALLASGALVGLSGCSDGDEATIVIEAPTTSTDNSQTNSGNTTNNPSPAPAPEPEPEPEPEAECPTGTIATDTVGECRLAGSITSDLTLTNDNVYFLDGRVTVGNGNCKLTSVSTCENGDTVLSATLTIEPGTEIKGLPSDDAQTAAVLEVTRGSKIMADGRADAPIVFSSAKDDDYTGAGEWGGVQLSGYAPHNKCDTDPCNVEGEGAANFVGGNDVDDSSGIMRYVVITEGGTEISSGDEINGLSLNAVGAGTTLEYIQIHDNLDDGVEYYGGSVHTKYLVVTGAGDDSVDWDEGYQGNLQYVIVRQTDNSRGEAFEMDTEGTLEFLSKPTLSNVTVIAGGQSEDNSAAMNFKKSTGGFFHNTVVTVDPDAASTISECAIIQGGAEDNVGTSLVFNNWIQDCANGAADRGLLAVDGDGNPFSMGAAAINVNAVAAQLTSTTASDSPSAVLSEELVWADFALEGSTHDVDFLENTRFIGAVNPLGGTDAAWYTGWTLDGTLSTPVEEQVACPAGTTTVEDNVCQLPSLIASDMRLIAGNEYLLNGRTVVGNGNCKLATATTCEGGSSVINATLTIDAGVEVKGLPSDDAQTAAVLEVTRGSKLMAIGTRSAPIIFSSAKDDDYVGAAEWGGVQLSGYAPHNKCDTDPCNVEGEGAANFVGGSNSADNSGEMRYVIITEGGTEISSGDEINGLSLNAVGNGTVLDYIQIHDNLDDGVEYYGGTVDTKHLVVTGAGDDSVDWDEGYQGNLQYVLVVQTENSAGEAFEMDTEGTTDWLSKPTLANVTVVAGGRAEDNSSVMMFKKSTGGFFHNTLVTVDADASGAIDTCATIAGGAEANINTTLVFNNWIQDCLKGGGAGTLSNEASVGNATVVIASPALDATYASQAPEAAVGSIDWAAVAAAYGVPSIGTGDPIDFDASFFKDETFIGAVNPDGSDPWWAGWTIPGSL